MFFIYCLSVGVSLGAHIIQTLLQIMPITMTYNVKLFVIVLEAGASYFLFARFRGPGTQSEQDANEHCH